MRRRVLAIALATVVFGAVPAGAQTDSIKDLEAKVDEASKRIADARVRADQASAVYFESQSRLDQIGDQLVQLSADVDAKRAEVDALKADLRGFAIDRYVAGGAAGTPSIFESTNLNQAVARGALADIVSDRKLDIIDKVRLAQAELEAKTHELESQKATEQHVTAETATQNNKLAKEVAALQSEYDKLNALLVGMKAEERKRVLEAARQRAAAAAAEKAAERAAQSRNRTANSGPVMDPPWLCPVAIASFSDTYGQPRSGGRRHLGVDMMAPNGTPVLAMVPGTVRYGRDGLGGLSFYLDSDNGVFYYGTHLSRFGPHDGHVDAGEIIGYVGSTGNASTPHLHLEIHPGGQGHPVNPTPTVAAYC